MTPTWKTLTHAGYSATVIFLEATESEPSVWVGEFAFPVRRVAHVFTGKTINEAEQKFREGVHAYLSQFLNTSGFQPEPEGQAGIENLIEAERKRREFEFSLLCLPELSGRQLQQLMPLVVAGARPISYNQEAMDELATHSKMTSQELLDWGVRVFIQGELERTPAGLHFTKTRKEKS